MRKSQRRTANHCRFHANKLKRQHEAWKKRLYADPWWQYVSTTMPHHELMSDATQAKMHAIWKRERRFSKC